MTLRQVEAIIPEPIARKNALNFLLGVGLLMAVDKSLSFRAVTKEEFTQWVLWVDTPRDPTDPRVFFADQRISVRRKTRFWD